MYIYIYINIYIYYIIYIYIYIIYIYIYVCEIVWITISGAPCVIWLSPTSYLGPGSPHRCTCACILSISRAGRKLLFLIPWMRMSWCLGVRLSFLYSVNLHITVLGRGIVKAFSPHAKYTRNTTSFEFWITNHAYSVMPSFFQKQVKEQHVNNPGAGPANSWQYWTYENTYV